jgi:hypothetical protein
MRHLSVVQKEFFKLSAEWWRSLPYHHQRKYLQRHPGSRRRITAPLSIDTNEPEELETARTVARPFSSFMPEQIIDIDKRFVAYNKQTKTLSFETSDIEKGVDTRRGGAIVLHNPKTGVKTRFTQFKVDYADPTHEDIAGWWYQSDDRKYKLLIIND